jgi:hypothetical protein
MIYPQISFQVRLNEQATLLEVGARVSKALESVFQPSGSKLFEDGEALEATCLGLWITLSHDPEISEGEVRNFVLMGMVKGDLEAQWEINRPNISISQYILGVLSTYDHGGWYIADVQELQREAGLPWLE